jgi:hypothetical protein
VVANSRAASTFSRRMSSMSWRRCRWNRSGGFVSRICFFRQRDVLQKDSRREDPSYQVCEIRFFRMALPKPAKRGA